MTGRLKLGWKWRKCADISFTGFFVCLLFCFVVIVLLQFNELYVFIVIIHPATEILTVLAVLPS